MRQPVSEKRKKVGLGGKGAGSEGTALVSSFGVLGNPNEVQIAFWGSTAYQPTLGRWKKSEQTVIVEEMGKVDRGPRLPPQKRLMVLMVFLTCSQYWKNRWEPGSISYVCGRWPGWEVEEGTDGYLGLGRR